MSVGSHEQAPDVAGRTFPLACVPRQAAMLRFHSAIDHKAVAYHRRMIACAIVCTAQAHCDACR